MTASAETRPPLASSLLLVVGVLTVAGGVLTSLGAAMADSEAGQLDRPVLVGLLLIMFGGIYAGAGWQARGRAEGWRGWVRVAAVVMACQVALRLAIFGVVGIGDAIVLGIVAVVALRESRTVEHANP